MVEINNEDKEKIDQGYRYFWQIVIFSILLVLGLWIWNWLALKDYKNDIRGTHGDMFGAVNAIFSGLAFAGIIISLYLQRIDLKNQQKQLELNHDEIQQTNREFKIQNNTLQNQKFENTLFNLLTIHHTIISNINFDFGNFLHKDNNLSVFLDKPFMEDGKRTFVWHHGDIFASREIFKRSLELLELLLEADFSLNHDKESGELQFNVYKDFNNNFNEIDIFKSKEFKHNDFSINSKFEDIYGFVYGVLSHNLGHYFRNLYRIIKSIDEKNYVENKLDNFKIQYSYTSLIRAQLSDDEIKWLFFNCLSIKGNEKFKPLVEKYSLFKIIDIDDYVYGFYSKFYNDCAFVKPRENEIKDHLNQFQELEITV